MNVLTVPLENLTRRLAETPRDFLGQGIQTAALFNDLLWEAGTAGLSPTEAKAFESTIANTKNTKSYQLIHMILWLIGDPALKYTPGLKEKIIGLLRLPSPQNPSQPFVSTLAVIVGPERFKSDPDRREELVRLLLKHLDLLPRGEELSRFNDRLRTLDSIERLRVIEETRAAAKRAKEIEEAMARQEAEEAASKYQRE